MNRIDRLFALLTFLQSKQFVAAAEISHNFQISLRTVYRDIKALGESGIPIGFEPGQGYFIVQGYFLPSLSFTSDEAHALILLTSLSEKFADPSVTRHARNAMTKIRSVLKDREKEDAENFSINIGIYRPPDAEEEKPFLNTVLKSITQKTILCIDYTNNMGETSQREIEPIGLTFYTQQWHLIAWCWWRKEYRDFKLRSIKSLVNSGKPFRKKEHWTLEKYIQSLKN